MILEANGVKVDASTRGNILRFQVLEQSEEATEIISQHGKIIDEETGFGLKINNRPDINRNEKNFYLRGNLADRNGDIIEKEFNSPAEARHAYTGLMNLLEKIMPPERMIPAAGGSTHVRQAIVTASQAKTLCLTANKHYPEERVWPGNVKPYQCKNMHYNEHQAQFVDVLNKSTGKVVPIEGEHINAHKVTNAAAKWAIKKLRDLFDEAEEMGDSHLTAVWRSVTGLRSPDSEKHDADTDRKKSDDREVGSR